jgi:predicted nucleic acid-binding protein
VTAAWDTTLVSRLYPGRPAERRLLDCAREGEPVAITAPTVMEVVRGVQAAVARKSSMAQALTWLTRLLTSDLVEILPLDRPAAIVAGRLRAEHPAPPSGARRAGVKPEQRAGWVMDIQIAACAWTHGRGIATENLRDFEVLSGLIAQLYPETSPLVVTGPPAA